MNVVALCFGKMALAYRMDQRTRETIEIHCTCEVIDSAEVAARSTCLKRESLLFIRAADTLLLSITVLLASTD